MGVHDSVIPLTTFADYIGRQVKLVMVDGTERFEQIEGVETATVIVWPGGTPDHISQKDIDRFYSIGGGLVATRAND
jgi:hypothetical protein